MILGERFQDVQGCAYPKFPHRLYVFLLLIIYTKYHVGMSNNPFILVYLHFRKNQKPFLKVPICIRNSPFSHFKIANFDKNLDFEGVHPK